MLFAFSEFIFYIFGYFIIFISTPLNIAKMSILTLLQNILNGIVLYYIKVKNKVIYYIEVIYYIAKSIKLTISYLTVVDVFLMQKQYACVLCLLSPTFIYILGIAEN